ncbi:hypothetical protein AVL61_07775 [Kocuria rosea subsp. polaris]|uniref:SGNH hydrolase-type esterase domain-containing protein n=1 Tax=Kocuria rosea subsp. polaris TaxID=136273 RepID=A0A0W8ILX8_KOCRO|nr:hypothetical protein AVL61_07775 [Kocuria polaris]
MQMDAAVQRAAAAVDATYISLIDPPVVKSHMVLEDRGHVGEDGHAAIAERVVSGLRRAEGV